MKSIIINGARENNLKNITLAIPKHKLVVLTGPSGSGKSTIAMDTLQRECQRQYVESMGMVADAIGKPKVDSIVGLSPSISVGQHVTNRNPRSTVGTSTDIHQYLRFLYSRLGERACPSCGGSVRQPLDAGMNPAAAEEEDEQRAFRCPHCRTELELMTMAHFSFNKPEGACPACGGLGYRSSLRTELVFDQSRSFREGGVTFLYDALIQYYGSIIEAGSEYYGFPFDMDTPIGDYAEATRDFLYYGAESEPFMRHYPGMKPPKSVTAGKFEGIVTGMWRRYKEKGGEPGAMEREGSYFANADCDCCKGTKLREEIRQVQVAGASIDQVSAMSLEETLAWTHLLKESVEEERLHLLESVMNDLPQRLERLIDVGLGYLSLDRQTITLSGGEAQRIRLASLLGSGLTGVLYILDEPTTGLHARDTAGLIRILERLKDLGNTVVVIEHDVDVMRAADHIIDIGPGAGSLGGEVVGEGRLEELVANEASVTGSYLREESKLAARSKRKAGNGHAVTIRDAHARNLKHIDVAFPLGCLISVTGVSGSGKSTLLFELLAESKSGQCLPEGCGGIAGLEHVEEIVTVDQSPIARMQRSNVATYTDVYTILRNLYAALPGAKRQQLTAKHFSFNTAGGRCETCQGLGTVNVDMNFLPDLEMRCPDCRGRRFQDAVLSVTYEGKSISDVLNMSVQESLVLFSKHSKVAAIVELLCEVGLGYLQWGQSIRTLSGGEGQRIRLAKELGKRSKGHTLYLLDEPTTGLHPTDVQRLSVLLHKLVDAGNTVIVVEHSLELMRESDWIIDIGPEGGMKGGELMAAGTPEQVAAVSASYTGRFLREAIR
ncbi:excinuclease ABC subunit UvrA [Paenibacillus sp. J5C_2022]|uniref:excinuclease ABC subunit UvrA n=1 Tax=Paenibacillus sp. J5C2022 TaxID=2977129 RepID=UPI0021CFC2C5|nr:excinuclease ABC subunit UvrA [Paenibacillus sp. J5C2022]MCU6713108.1 excinuclease ABC subunit UvrA [Paenibacillus sp. J5C2022]